jgi:hypothetical protein
MAMHTDHSHPHGGHGATRAEGQEHAPEVYDREINVRGVWITMGGILGITLFAMVAMWFLSLALIGAGERGDRALMPVEEAQRLQTLQLENRLQGGVVLDGDGLDSDYDRRARRLGGWVPPGLDETWPADIELPPSPRVQYSPMNDWLILKDDQARELMAPEDPAEAGTRVSIDEAMDYVLSAGLVRSDGHRETSRTLYRPQERMDSAGELREDLEAGDLPVGELPVGDLGGAPPPRLPRDEAATPTGTEGDSGAPAEGDAPAEGEEP